MHITPAMMEAAYEFLRTTLPFRRWHLPHPDQLDFRVLVTRERYGHFVAYVNSEQVGEIAMSTKIRSPEMLVQVMAHEMVHIRQEILGYRDNHGKHFQRLAALVCKRHGWALQSF